MAHAGNGRDDHEWRQWLGHVRDELVPMVEQSAIALSVVPEGDKVDGKFCVELGVAIMLDKPIVVLALRGTEVPAKLAQVADEVIYADTVEDPETEAALGKAIARALDET